MAWTVSFEPRALSELKKRERTAQRRVMRFLQERLTGNRNPRDSGKSLTGDKLGMRRYRVAEYRVVGHTDDERLAVLVLRIAHRKDTDR